MSELPAGIGSLLDTDLYKITMQAAVLQHYPTVEVSYKLFNRGRSEQRLNEKAFLWLKSEIHKLSHLSVSPEELAFLQDKLPYLPHGYLDFLQSLRLRPAQEVEITYDEDAKDIDLSIHGLWSHVILYEIPLLSLISEAYFKFVDQEWNYDEQLQTAKAKGLQLIEAGCAFSEFGTRRRRDYHTQDLVLQGLIAATKESRGNGRLSGTSNVHFAYKYDLNPVGTVAHEWFMACAAISGDYLHANRLALSRWRDTYGSNLGIALTDTFGTTAFLEDFDEDLARHFAGVRQDSGKPEDFAQRMVSFYKEKKIDPQTKTIVFSDGLNVDRCCHLQDVATDLGIKASFGVGTFLTNDFKNTQTKEKSPAMNIVIKMTSSDGKPAIKISDEVHKNTGNAEQVRHVKKLLGYREQDA